jgi:hypothetical protein
MNLLETLYFPDTTIYTDRQFPIFLLFAPVHILQAVENENTKTARTSPPDTFMDSHFCQVHTPSPLGDDLTRFLHLIEDIKNRKDDYAAQLSALTVASMSAPALTPRENSKNEIISSILGQEVPQQDNQEKLWQARLVLKIAEILDREEEEIAEALTFLDDTEGDLFGKLQGKDDEFPGENPYDDLLQLKKKINPPRRETIANRLRAWQQILSKSHAHLSPIWLTTRSEAADILLEKYEKKNQKAITPFLTMDIPAKSGKDAEQAFLKTETFLEDSTELRKTLFSHLTGLLKGSQNSITMPPDSHTFLNSWNSLTEKHFPTNKYGRLTLSFYHFEPHPAALLDDPTLDVLSDTSGILALLS